MSRVFGHASILRGARRVFALLAALSLLHAAGPARAALSTLRPTGQVALTSGLDVDGVPAVLGQTFFSGSGFGTSERSRALLELCNRARLELSGGAALKLDFDDDELGGTLDSGAARVAAPRGVAAALTTADASVASVALEPAVFTLHVSKEGTTLSVQSGRVEMRAGGAVKTAGAGESLRAAHGSQPATPQGNGLSERKRTGIFIGIAAALTAVILVIVGRGDEETVPPCGGTPIIISPGGPTNPDPCSGTPL